MIKMRYHELIGLVDDTFAKYRKYEATPDSTWTPFGFYKNLNDVKKNDYSVYCGAVRNALNDLIDLYQKDQKIQFNEKEIHWLFSTLETANNQNNDNDLWTDIMFRSKYNFINVLEELLSKYDVAG